MAFQLSEAGRKMILIIAALFLVALGVGLVFKLAPAFIYFKGLLLGSLFAALKVLMLERTLSKAVNMEPKSATNYSRMHYTLRYFLTGLMLAVAALEPSISFLGAVIGLFTFTAAAYSVNFFLKR